MVRITQVTPGFFVSSGQFAPSDVAEAARAGVRSIVNNRPDGEAADQAPAAEIAAAAESAGLAFWTEAFVGQPSPDAVQRTADFLAGAEMPVLAYCRTGTRSITLWALAQASAGKMAPREILERSSAAGYDLSRWEATLEQLMAASGR